MSAVTVGHRSSDAAAYGGLIDALGGIAAAVLAIIGLTGFDPEGMAGIATIVFGAALLIQGGTILSEYMQLAASGDFMAAAPDNDGLPAMFLAGAAGIVLGVLALLHIAPVSLISIAVMAFGSALLLSGRSVKVLQTLMQQEVASRRSTGLVAGPLAGGSTGIQVLVGLASIILGILAVAGHTPLLLCLAALLLLGVTVIMTGGTLSALVLSFMRPAAVPRRSPPGIGAV